MMRIPSPNRRRQRGAVAIMVALALLVLLSVVGLVVDGGLAYLVKARLNAAVDAAALAAARAVPDGNNQTEQTASAQQAAADFFAANISSNYMLSQPSLTSTTVTFNGGMATIDVRAQAPMPVSLMQVMGFTSLTPTAYAQTIRKDLDMALVVDTSGSLSSTGAAVRSATTTFLNQFNVTQDRVALIHFASGTEVDNPINTSARGFNRTSMLANVAAFNFDGGTSSVEGMWNARNQLNAIPTTNRSSLRVIVFFSDGEPSSFNTTLALNSGGCTAVGALDSKGYGLFRTDISEDTAFTGTNAKCTFSTNYSNSPRTWTVATKMPTVYNSHSDVSLPIVTGSPRVVTSDVSTEDAATRNVDRAARNLAEGMAQKAQSEGIYVFTLGLGAELKTASGYDNEMGETVLKCMANVADAPSRCYDPTKPVGMYCYAATTADLTPCFSRLASAILRISK